jgi:signal transduction histidine kinase
MPKQAYRRSLTSFQERVKGVESKSHGLGLAFVEAVVCAHGGSVAASNRRGGGAILDIRLPTERPLGFTDSSALALAAN